MNYKKEINAEVKLIHQREINALLSEGVNRFIRHLISNNSLYTSYARGVVSAHLDKDLYFWLCKYYPKIYDEWVLHIENVLSKERFKA
jgi:hypothetical protein